MLPLLIIVLFGMGFAYFATQNTAAVPIVLNGLVYYLPMYLLVLGSLLIGLFVSWILSLVDTVSTWFSLSGKNSQINRLQDRIRQLEMEKSRLAGQNEGLIKKEVIVNHKDESPSVIARLRHSLS